MASVEEHGGMRIPVLHLHLMSVFLFFFCFLSHDLFCVDNVKLLSFLVVFRAQARQIHRH